MKNQALDGEALGDYLRQVGHAFNMVAELHGWLVHDDLAEDRYFHVWHAIGESWLVNVRLLAEFFLDNPRKDDVAVSTFLAPGVTWTLDDDGDRCKLVKETLVARSTEINKHLMHLAGQHRASEPLWKMPAAPRAEAIELLFGLGDRFAAGLTGVFQTTFMGYLITAKSLRRWPPPLIHPGWRPDIDGSSDPD